MPGKAHKAGPLVQREVVGLPTETLFNGFYKVVLPGIRSAYGIRGKVRPEGESMVYTRSGRPVGYRVLRRVERDPRLAKKWVVGANKRIGSASETLNEMEDAVEKTEVPLSFLADRFHEMMARTTSGGLDRIFDHEEYERAIKRHLKRGYPREEIERGILNTILTYSGEDSMYWRERNALLHLANRYGRHHQRGGAFKDYGESWYLKNRVPSKDKFDGIDTSENGWRDDLDMIRESRGIKEGDFDGVMDSFRELRREARERSRMREEAEKNILRHTRPESKAVVRALLKMAGNAAETNEHAFRTESKGLIAFARGAKARGMTKDEATRELMTAVDRIPGP